MFRYHAISQKFFHELSQYLNVKNILLVLFLFQVYIIINTSNYLQLSVILNILFFLLYIEYLGTLLIHSILFYSISLNTKTACIIKHFFKSFYIL